MDRTSVFAMNATRAAAVVLEERSDDPDWLDDIHDMAYFYRDVMREMDLRNVHLVGLSLGGWIAADIAIRDLSLIHI